MASKHDETIATFLLVAKANKQRGITAVEISDKCQIPVVSVYRVLREEDNSFFQSMYPTRPAGYYFDSELMAETLHRKIDNSISTMVTQQKAAELLKRVEKAYENISPISKHFLHIRLSDKELESKLLVRLNGKAIEATWPEVTQAISTADGKDKRIANLLLVLKSLM